MKNPKRKGTRNEHRSMRILEGVGYACTRSAGSLGLWDIVGIGPDLILLVQVKTERWPSAAEIQRLKEFPCPGNCRKLIHVWQKGESFPLIKWL